MASDDREPPTCEACGCEYTMENGHEPTRLCDACAQDAAETLLADRDADRATIARLTAERDSLQRHFDAAGPEHDLLSLLDLYHDRQRKAEAERDEARAALATETANANAYAHERDEAAAVLRRHQTEPDPADPDGWIRRSALNHWAERAAAAIAERDEARALLRDCIADTWPDGLFTRVRVHLGGGK